MEAKPKTGTLLLGYGKRVWDSPVAVPVISLLLSFLVIAVMAMIFGVSPGAIMVALFEGALKGKYAMTSTVKETIPLALAGLAVYLPFRACLIFCLF